MISRIINKIHNAIAKLMSKLWLEESIQSSKSKWNKLAEENAMYYVVSKKKVLY
ncbi:hypothetical protein H6775_01795 [Candidatus Nomurabacteria bacterium]|nr:hypothetical protein [Candidatus Nomurabacteria bacterium]